MEQLNWEELRMGYLRTWRAAAFLGLAVFAGMLLGCSSGSRDDIVRIGISPFQDTLIPMLGDTKGWYDEAGVNVEIVILGWTEVQEALASGAVDIAVNNISAIISTHEQFSEGVYAYGINTFDDGFALMVRPEAGLHPLSAFLERNLSRAEAVKQTAAQLQGKTVVTTSNTDMEQGVAAAARRGGLDFERDIQIIDMNPDEGLAAFLTGVGDAYIGGVPQRSRAKREGMIELLTGSDLGPPPINGFVTTKKFAKERRADLLAVINVWFRIVAYVNTNPDEAAGIVIAKLNELSGAQFTVEDFKQYWNGLEHFPADPAEAKAEILLPSGRNYWKRRWDDCNEYFYAITKRINKPVEPEGVFIMPEIHEEYLKTYGKE
ncbi:MAG: ABC transporter substrate-binding protein [Chloroflexi bacterium]|nr:ABC transporter substrate-binding protein [Chloroflexota bacterium]